MSFVYSYCRFKQVTALMLTSSTVRIALPCEMMVQQSYKLLLLLIRYSSSSEVAGMAFNVILPLCSGQCVLLLNQTLSIYILYESFHLVLCLPLSLFPGTGASYILLSTCPSSLLLTCPYYSSLFSLIFLVTGATFTDHLTSF